ncbi:MAG: SUMF1/EgtB/PvdO family nonheme iron enzyme, partial [Planctomycetota bacterium]
MISPTLIPISWLLLSAEVFVPGGPFTMGTGAGEPDAAPPHRRDLPAFWIDASEVTAGEYARFISATGRAPPPSWGGSEPPAGSERLPVTDVTWFDAMEYALWAGKRLPTEAEWEKAARGADARPYPWGFEDDPARRNIDSGRLEPAGSRPGGASPFGALDLSGNAWEWTADWYDGYPGTDARSVQFGRSYKVFRGGAAEYYYGLANTGTATQRGRAVPYGSHDFVGFRCARSDRPEDEPYDPRTLLAEARALLCASLREPRPLPHDREREALAAAREIPLAISGPAGTRGLVRAGLPFPEGALASTAGIALAAPDGSARPVQVSALSAWKEGSVRWALVTFPAAAGEVCSLRWGDGLRPAVPPHAVRVAGDGAERAIETGAARFELGGPRLFALSSATGGAQAPTPAVEGAGLRIELDAAGGPETLEAHAPEAAEVEELGPLSASIRLRGTFGRPSSEAAFRYDLRVAAAAGSSRATALLTLTLARPREASVRVRDVRAAFRIAVPCERVAFGVEGGARGFDATAPLELRQRDDLAYEIRREGRAAGGGTRAPGWIAAGGRGAASGTGSAKRWLALGVRRFWENHPAALFFDGTSIGARLFAGEDPIEWEGGLAKTWEIVLAPSGEEPAAFALDPLRAAAPPAWMCAPAALGAPVLPRGGEAIERFPYWELVRETSFRSWVRGMPTGLRHFGDAYMGGPYKGKNAYANLEYDVPFNFLLEFLRTADPWYLEAAEPMVRHQADIDTNHATGQPWKHSPEHTTTEAELGHVFVRGLLLHRLLTGDARSLEVAREIGDWIAGELLANRGVGNERQIGWSLYALTALHEVAREPRYLEAARALADRLAAGQDARGKFAIRWDNRIAFFNGIAANGLLAVAEAAGDRRIEECVLRLARRTLGMYPEYACRTLHLFSFAADATGDPRYLDALERTWELSMEFLLPRDAAAAETHAWKFRDFAARRGLLPFFRERPEALPEPGSWRAIRIRSPSVEAFVERVPDGAPPSEPAALLAVREGLARGSAELFSA